LLSPRHSKQTRRFRLSPLTRKKPKWWYENRKTHDQQLAAAANSGEAQVLTKKSYSTGSQHRKKTGAGRCAANP
jgi:hypothetical protein